MSEFNLIKRYFTWNSRSPNIVKGVGDDAAVINISNDKSLVTSVDTSIAGVHFPMGTPAFDVGHKSLAVNLSDIAAMGATPKWFTLALSLPSIDKPENTEWLEGFSQGLKQQAEQSGCDLIGGDTTQGNLSITIQIMGVVDKGTALLRSGASVGDLIYVTGTLGDAAVGLATIINGLEMESLADVDYCQKRLNTPTARILEGQFIKQFATSCIDISDGFLQDLGHILKVSQVGACINTQKIPLSNALSRMNKSVAIQAALSGGDDYELLFTIPKSSNAAFLKIASFKTSCVGEINTSLNTITDEKGDLLNVAGYNHFNV